MSWSNEQVAGEGRAVEILKYKLPGLRRQFRMLAIITSWIVAPTKNWDYHVWLLGRTNNTILAQTNDSFIVAVVCHEKPEVPQAKHPKLHFLPVDFPPPQRDHSDMCVDKVLKLSVG